MKVDIVAGIHDRPRIRLAGAGVWLCKSPRFIVRTLNLGPDVGWTGRGETPAQAYQDWAFRRASGLVRWSYYRMRRA